MPTRSYRLESSEYLDDKEVVTVKDPTTGRLIWSKTRSLTEEEIVSTVLDAHYSPRFSVHRPRQSVLRSTSKTSPPWPQYLVLRSPSLPDDRYIPIIDVASPSDSNKEESGQLEFKLSIPTQRRDLKSPRPSPLDLATHSTISLNDDEETDPLTPTRANPNPSQPPKRKPRPKSATYRVDMTPSLSQDSASSSATDVSSSSSMATSDSRDPLSTISPTSPSSPPPTNLSVPPDFSQVANFRLQPFLSPQLKTQLLQQNPKSVTSRALNRLRSLVVEEGKKWSCVWTNDDDESKETTAESPNVVMYFEEDQPTLFPSPSKGTLTLSTDLIDRSGYEPSFWVTLAMAWVECLEERVGWREGRGGD
ncbi:hypothetical protein JCM5350_003924 [Sporobolomyces pararoseus]